MNENKMDNSGCFRPSSEISIPKEVGRYTIMYELGRGSMGVVLLGWDPFIERLVAIKIPQLTREDQKKSDKTFMHGFFHEARSAGILVHPNIVSIFDADVCQDFCYLAMEHVNGPTLKEFSRKDKLLPVEKVIDIAFHACRALDYAHNKGVVHWDIKPSNIMLTDAGAVKITDFGISRMSHKTLQADVDKGSQCNITGTFAYMSPQHLDAKGLADPRSDVFSLGCVFYELLTGIRPFQGDNLYTIMFKIVNEDPVSILDLRPELPGILEKIVNKALAKDPDQRYQSCMDFAYDLGVSARHSKTATKTTLVEDKVDYICNLPFFENFSRKQIEKILPASDILRVPTGGVIVTEGEIDDSLYIILSGKVEVLKNDIKINMVDRGECFGEMAYLCGQPRTATLKASTDCVLMKISATMMDKVSKSVQLLFMKSFSTNLAARVLRTDALVMSLMNKE
jgi:eukaryotic-like serine/threonine-protein kinase